MCVSFGFLSVIHIINVTYFLFSAANVFVVFVPDTEYCFMYRKTFRLWNRVVAFGIYLFNISIGNSMICSDIWHKYHE